MGFDVVERIEDDHAFVAERDVVGLRSRLAVLLGIKAGGPDRDPLLSQIPLLVDCNGRMGTRPQARRPASQAAGAKARVAQRRPHLKMGEEERRGPQRTHQSPQWLPAVWGGGWSSDGSYGPLIGPRLRLEVGDA